MTLRELMNLVSDLLIDGTPDDTPVRAIMDSNQFIGLACGDKLIMAAEGKAAIARQIMVRNGIPKEE